MLYVRIEKMVIKVVSVFKSERKKTISGGGVSHFDLLPSGSRFLLLVNLSYLLAFLCLKISVRNGYSDADVSC